MGRAVWARPLCSTLFAAICDERATSRHSAGWTRPGADAGLPFSMALQQRAASAIQGENPFDCLNSDFGSLKSVLFVDTYEALEGLDGWMREEFFCRACRKISSLCYRAGCRSFACLAGRRRLAADAARDSHSAISVPDESSANICCNIPFPVEQHPAILEFTHGYPLALSLVADVFAQKGSICASTWTARKILWRRCSSV